MTFSTKTQVASDAVVEGEVFVTKKKRVVVSQGSARVLTQEESNELKNRRMGKGMHQTDSSRQKASSTNSSNSFQEGEKQESARGESFEDEVPRARNPHVTASRKRRIVNVDEDESTPPRKLKPACAICGKESTDDLEVSVKSFALPKVPLCNLHAKLSAGAADLIGKMFK